MQIVCTFESYEEFLAFAGLNKGKAAKAEKKEEPKAVKEEPKAVKEETAPAPQEQPEQPAEELPFKEEEPAVDITVVRKTLTKLNKQTGKNTAKDLIKEFGAAKLTDVAASDLPALLKKAEEMLDA